MDVLEDPRKVLDNALRERDEMSKELLPLLDNLESFLKRNGISGSIVGGVVVDTRYQPPVYPSVQLYVDRIHKVGTLYLDKKLDLDGWELLRRGKAYLSDVIGEIYTQHEQALDIISKENVDVSYIDGFYYVNNEPVGDPKHGIFL